MSCCQASKVVWGSPTLRWKVFSCKVVRQGVATTDNSERILHLFCALAHFQHAMSGITRALLGGCSCCARMGARGCPDTLVVAARAS